tara:strand:+ start:1439 stop:2293 length:855 start_codon:yes stop_codon:yes gene_type:complete
MKNVLYSKALKIYRKLLSREPNIDINSVTSIMSELNRGNITPSETSILFRWMRKKKPLPTRGFNRKQVADNVFNFDIHAKSGLGNKLNITSFGNTPMIDLDLPKVVGSKSTHPSMSVTAGTAGEAIDQLRDFAGANQSYLRAFMTKGGVRAFDLSHAEEPLKYYKRKLATKTGDPLYSGFSMHRNTFDVRVSPKKAYEKESIDYVAAPLLDLAAPGAKVNPLNRYNVEKFHDDIIKRTLHSTKDRSRPSRARTEIIKDAQRLLDSMGGNDADAIVKTMKKGGIF